MPNTASPIEPDRTAWYRRTVPAVFALVIALSFGTTLIYKLRFDGIFACPSNGYGVNAFLADCTARTYGDYDHGAFWFGLEPKALQAAADADVLLVGSSRLQFAFSGDTTASWFSGLGIRHYLLGFSNSETVVFVEPLVSRMRPRARAYVINVDRFFDDRVSPPTGQILNRGDIKTRYTEKQTWQTLHKALCSAIPMACGTAVAVFRERETGRWTRTGSGNFQTKPVSDGEPSNEDRWGDYASLGKAFLAKLPVNPECIVLTLVPSVDSRRDEAMAIAADLGHELLSPEVDDLSTFDGSHLDEPSAARWSDAFLQQAGPVIQKCVDAARVTTG